MVKYSSLGGVMAIGMMLQGCATALENGSNIKSQWYRYGSDERTIAAPLVLVKERVEKMAHKCGVVSTDYGTINNAQTIVQYVLSDETGNGFTVSEIQKVRDYKRQNVYLRSEFSKIDDNHTKMKGYYLRVPELLYSSSYKVDFVFQWASGEHEMCL